MSTILGFGHSCLILPFWLSFGVAAASEFLNLDFEQANPVPLKGTDFYPYAVALTNGLPFWNAFPELSDAGSHFIPYVLYDTVSLGAAAVSLHDTNSLSKKVIQGEFSVLLQPSLPPGTDASISQTGLIPASARSLEFSGVGAFRGSFGAQEFPITTLGDTGGFFTYGADISSYAGQEGELKFWGGGMLDDIRFSPSAVPEPNGIALLLLGGVIAIIRKSRQR